jgi:hypothetical protein
MFEPVLKADALRQLACLLPAFLFGPSLVIKRDLDIFKDAELLNEVIGLENETEASPADRRQCIIFHA